MTRIPIRWRDFDPLGHVNSAVFMTLLETGRDLWLRDTLGPSFSEYVIVRIELDFRSELGLDTEYVESHQKVETIGTTSITLREQLIDPAGTCAAQARVVIVLWDPQARRPRPVSTDEREALTAGTPGEARR